MRIFSLGYPWLASLSTKQLLRAKTKDGQICVLEVEPISLDYLYLENPDAISESSHLFEFGMILIEIAVDSPEDSDSVKLEDHIYMHPTNSLSCTKLLAPSTTDFAFCVRDRKSTPSYTRIRRYQYPELTDRERYLKDSSRYTMHKQFQGRLQYRLGSSDLTFLGCKSYVTLHGLLLLDHL